MVYVLLGVGYLLVLVASFTPERTGGWMHVRPVLFYFGGGMCVVAASVLVAGLL